jgi:hypothetical protein
MVDGIALGTSRSRTVSRKRSILSKQTLDRRPDANRPSVLRRVTNACSAASVTRIEFTIRTCSSAPLAHSLYTVAVHTRSRSATSRTPQHSAFFEVPVK